MGNAKYIGRVGALAVALGVGIAVEQLEHARAARHGALRHPERHAEPAHRADQHQHVAVERDELADGDLAVDHLAPAHEQQRREAELG